MTPRIFLSLALSFALMLLGPALFADDPEETKEGGLTGTGITGVITKLGSIHVNGHRITFESDMEVSGPLGPRSASLLQKGNTVAAQVVPNGSDWKALSLVQTYPIIGPVSARDQHQFTVMGTIIDVASIVDVAEFAAGDWVAVSGLWRGDAIVASKVDIIDPLGHAQLFGSYVQPNDGEALRLGTTTIRNIVLEHAQPGDVIRVFGVPGSESIEVKEVDLGLFSSPVGVVLAQGYVIQTSPNGHYSVPGSGITVFVSDDPILMAEQDQILCGLVHKDSALIQQAQQQWPKDADLLGC